jgi:LacI family transcriptional regulator
LCSLGLRHLLFCGEAGFFHIGERQQGFVQRAREAGVTVRVHTVNGPCRSWEAWQDADRRLDQLLRQMPRPFGVQAANDSLAQRVLLACERLGLAVPDEVAVLGIDNVLPICHYTDPPLTSIDRNMEQVGFEAARLLDRLMAGQAPPGADVVVQPRGLIKRHSSDTIGFRDPDVRAVISYMRTHLSEIFGVERLVPLVAISRRGLERHFRHQVGSTLHDYLSRLRIERCMELLAAEPTRSATHLATACGFSSAKRLALVFRRITGGTLEDYRHALEAR